MPTWNHTVNFTHFWRNDDISIQAKGVLAAKELRRLMKHSFEGDWELLEIIEMFSCILLAEDMEDDFEFTPTDDFDSRMFDLYEWADYNRVWIET